jgi:RNA-directed DNA polymerase
MRRAGALSADLADRRASLLGFTFICGRHLPAQTEDPARSHAGEVASNQTGCGGACISQLGKWLRQVVSGYFNYHAVPTNSRALHAFRHFVAELWQRSLRRRSQKHSMTWERFTQLAND